MPVQKIAEAAKSEGIEVMIDAAHSLAQLELDLATLSCDYLGASLHKWLCAPFGSGILYINKAKISKVYPLFAPFESIKKTDIRKFEITGTCPISTIEAIVPAVELHRKIGPVRKRERLHFLKKYWLKRVEKLRGISLWTHPAPNASCAMATFGIEGYTPQRLYEMLKNRYGIYTSPIYHSLVPGVRVSPHIYTNLTDLDRLVNAVEEAK